MSQKNLINLLAAGILSAAFLFPCKAEAFYIYRLSKINDCIEYQKSELNYNPTRDDFRLITMIYVPSKHNSKPETMVYLPWKKEFKPIPLLYKIYKK